MYKNIYASFFLALTLAFGAIQTQAQDFTIWYEIIENNVAGVDSVKLYLENNTGTDQNLEATNISILFDPTKSVANTLTAPAVDKINDSYRTVFFTGGPYQTAVNTSFLPATYDGVSYASRFQYANTYFSFLGGSPFPIPAASGLNHAMTVVFSRITPAVAGDFYVQDVSQFLGVNMAVNGNPNTPYNAQLITPGTFPVELLDFTAYQTGEATVQLDWATAQEENSASFQIERSIDGSSFASIGELSAAGNSNEVIEYTYLDFPVPSTTLFYRLRQVDIDGSFTYSDVRQVVISQDFSATVELFPNPAASQLNVRAQVAPERKFDLYIIDVQGRIMYQENGVGFDQGALKLDVSKYAAGQYMVQLVEDASDEIYSERFTIVR